jgi:HK97 family phage prohead protease
MIYGYKRFESEVKDVDKKQGIVTGYFSSFDVKDSDGDIIRQGAFKKSINEWFPKGRIKHLLNHDPRQALGKITELKEDSFGLYYESKIGSHALGQDFIKMVESDIVKEHSIGFNIVNERKSESGNELLDIKLFEGSSLTAWGANEYTPLVGMKSIDIQARVDRLKKLEKFVKSTDATDDTIELLLLEIKQLNQLIESLTSTAAAVNAPTEQKGEDVSAVSDAFDILLYRHFK